MKILGLIPARKNSQRLPGKHLKQCAGKPLIDWTIEAAEGAGALSAYMICTDDDEILDNYEMATWRPPIISGHDVPTVRVVQWVLNQVGEEYDAVCVLQPTSPLRTSADIQEACGLLAMNVWADSVVSYTTAGSQYTLVTNGATYLARTETIERGTLIGDNWLPYIMPPDRSVDIDTAADLDMAERLLTNKVAVPIIRGS